MRISVSMMFSKYFIRCNDKIDEGDNVTKLKLNFKVGMHSICETISSGLINFNEDNFIGRVDFQGEYMFKNQIGDLLMTTLVSIK